MPKIGSRVRIHIDHAELNGAPCRIIGYRHSELLDMDVWDVVVLPPHTFAGNKLGVYEGEIVYDCMFSKGDEYVNS